jgi:hypothetical protein
MLENKIETKVTLSRLIFCEILENFERKKFSLMVLFIFCCCVRDGVAPKILHASTEKDETPLPHSCHLKKLLFFSRGRGDISEYCNLLKNLTHRARSKNFRDCLS